MERVRETERGTTDREIEKNIDGHDTEKQKMGKKIDIMREMVRKREKNRERDEQ